MPNPVITGAFKRDYRLAMRRGKKIEKLDALIRLLIDGVPLDLASRDHALTGEWADRRGMPHRTELVANLQERR